MTDHISKSASVYPDEIDLTELAREVWAQRWLVLAVTAVVTILAVVYLHLAAYKYTAELRVTPSQAAGAQRASGGVAGLASLAGVNLSQGNGATPFDLYIDGLKSRLVSDRLARDPVILRHVFRGEWNAQAGRFVQPQGAVPAAIHAIGGALGVPEHSWEAPDGARLQSYLAAHISILQNPKTPVVVISIEDESPEFATYILSAMNRELDGLLRQKALLRSSQYITYLSEQLQKVTVAEHRLALVETLADQERTRMVASSTLAYAAEPFGTPTASLRPTSPKPLIVIGIGLFLGAALGIGLAVARFKFQSSSSEI